MSIRVLQGDCRAVLKTLADASVHACITSPPYFNLRDYGTATWDGGDPACDHTGIRRAHGDHEKQSTSAGTSRDPVSRNCILCGARRIDAQIGLEASPDLYIAEMVAVFREVKRVLRDDGTLWLNLGDSYNNFRVSKGPGQALHGRDNLHGKPAPDSGGRGWIGAKEKDLLMMPARVALALQADGWVLRSDIIWQKPNPMPESCSDRPTSSHEHVFMFAKSNSTTYWVHRDKPGSRTQPEPDYRWVHRETKEEVAIEPPRPTVIETVGEHLTGVDKTWRRINLWEGRDYFFDADAVREPISESTLDRFGDSLARTDGRLGDTISRSIADGKTQFLGVSPSGRNIRNVWTIATQAYPDAHFATFPAELAARCVKAGTSERGCCAKCGAPLVRMIERGEPDLAHQQACGGDASGAYYGASTKGHAAAGVQDASVVKARILAGMVDKTTIGWLPSCQCGVAEVVPATVLDCFAGAFTAPMVADRLQRNAIGIELSHAYCEMARNRLVKDAGMFAEIAAE